MERKDFRSRLKMPSKPTGQLQWDKAVKTILLIILAVIIGELLGLSQGIKVIMLITLNATMVMDLPLPFRKIVPLAFLGFLLTLLAFICSYLSLLSLPLFVIFTIFMAFFCSSLYIFSETMGSFGFTLFLNYLLAVSFVNPQISITEWSSYIILSYLVVSILLIPRFLKRKKDILKMVAYPFLPESSLERVLYTKQALSGIAMDIRDYQLFKVGTYLKGTRSYAKLLASHQSGPSKELFQGFVDVLQKTSQEISSKISNTSSNLEIVSLDEKLNKLDKIADSSDPDVKNLQEVSKAIRFLLQRTKELLQMDYPSTSTKKISSSITIPDVIIANFNLDNFYIRHALRFSLALSLGLLAIYMTHGRDILWITMGILLVMKPDITTTLDNFVLRVCFSFVAIILAIILGFLLPHYMIFWLSFLLLFLFRLFFPTYMGLAIVAITIYVVVTWPTGPVWANAMARMIDILLGGIIAFFCAYLIFSGREKYNLSEQIARVIRANSDYAKNILSLPVEEEKHNHKQTVKSYRKYLLEIKNLESAIKKIEDTFDDVQEDLSIYNQLQATNHKLAVDLTDMATLMESDESSADISRFKEQLTNTLNELALSVEKNVILPRTTINKLYNISNPDNNVYEDINLDETIENYLNWIIIDIRHLQEQVDLAIRSGTLKRYRNLD